ncbi:MAG TPA: c-type cytochrome [Ardenticatenaceae bacterium]|nr:c-type cytochrome [Ardenticatenaceae bacterium]
MKSTRGRAVAPLVGALLALTLTGCALGSAGGTSRAASTATPAASAEEGRVLFRNKGCIGCHVNERVEGPRGMAAGFGPDLTDYSNDADFLRRWLDDPQAVRPGTEMPEIDLSEAEIEDLIAFLNEPR